MDPLDEHLSQGARLTLEIWHPNCWTLEVTEATDAGLLAHTVYQSTDGKVKGHFTAYGDSSAEIDELVRATQESALTSSVVEMERRYEFEHRGQTPGNTSRELFVEYDPQHTISDALASHGFLQDAPVRVRDGREYWPVFVDEADRDRLHDRLETVRAEFDAEVDVTKIYSHAARSEDAFHRVDILSERQREIFELACEHNYYAWPREITTRELAEEAGLAKTTLLEHLRKAEAKLLNPDSGDERRTL
ncbi:helix-turn-helix domain-containing protein [Natronobeatus ordinarius]|uniref:helix-turn-helix domain-containing protein n=1 Tax=Natronobeatus ordinarius TaxID=2963433 RepID=UPI0020CDB289|nr:helix-turn-helix domain-containing protein [Natronobeatus ordinarius]